MDPATLLPWLSGPVGAAAVLIWVVVMLRRDLADMHRALDAERRRADSAEEAARTTNALLAGIINRVPQ